MEDLLLARLRRLLADRFDVVRRLAEGGMAFVYLAHDHKLPRQIALKVLKPEFATGVGVQRFKREIGIAARLVHPHIVPLLDSDQVEDLFYYTMPLVTGDTLRPRIKTGRAFPVDEAVRIACQVADALACAHASGIVHRDIKPENIMFTGEYPLVTDFGIARAITAARDTGEGEFVGTPAYSSPEQAGDGPLDGRSDVYSLGCVLYEMLVGALPFPNTALPAIAARLAGDQPPSVRAVRREVPEALDRVVLRALARAPADRFATAADFRDALASRTSLPRADEPSVAVLAFSNMSGDATLEYLGDGIAEEIVSALDRLPGLRVAARTSSFSFRARDLDLPEIGARLGVATVLEGSVRKAGIQLRVSARLVNVADNFPVWSETYDRQMTDVFAIQDDIARSIAAALKIRLKDWQGRPQPRPELTPPTANLDAYDLYLQGRYHLAQRGQGLKRALELFHQAATLDPQYALAHAGLAETCVVLAQYGFVPPLAIRERAVTAAGRALELEPELAEAHCAAGALSMVCDWDWAAAAAALQRAVELNPRFVPARIWYAFHLVFVEGRFDAGIAQAQRAVDLDPLAPLPAMQLGMTLLGAKRYDEAAAALRRSAELAPTMFTPPHLGLLYNQIGRTDEAIAALDAASGTAGRHPWTLCALAVCYRSRGDLDRVQAIHDELASRARFEYVQSSMLAILEAALGRMDEAFALLHRACDEHDGIIYLSKRYPFLSLLQADPRMDDIFRRVGFPAAP